MRNLPSHLLQQTSMLWKICIDGRIIKDNFTQWTAPWHEKCTIHLNEYFNYCCICLTQTKNPMVCHLITMERSARSCMQKAQTLKVSSQGLRHWHLHNCYWSNYSLKLPTESQRTQYLLHTYCKLFCACCVTILLRPTRLQHKQSRHVETTKKQFGTTEIQPVNEIRTV